MMTPAGITVIGAGGHAKVVIAALHAAGHCVEAVYDDNSRLWGQARLGVPIRGPIARLGDARGLRAVIAIGDNAVRSRLAGQLNLAWTTVVHPHAWVHGSVCLRAGAVIGAGAVIQPDCMIGAHAIVNTCASMDHDSMIGDFAHLAPGVRLAGGVRVGSGALLGVGTVVVPGVTVGATTTVGAGSIVLTDLPPGVVAFGTPVSIRRPQRSPRVAG